MVLQAAASVGTMMTPPPTPTQLPKTPAASPRGSATLLALCTAAIAVSESGGPVPWQHGAEVVTVRRHASVGNGGRRAHVGRDVVKPWHGACSAS